MSDPVFVFDGVRHELVKIVEEGDEYLVYGLKWVNVGKTGYEFIWEDQSHASWGYKPYEDADVTNDPAVFFEDVKRWSQHKVRP